MGIISVIDFYNTYNSYNSYNIKPNTLLIYLFLKSFISSAT